VTPEDSGGRFRKRLPRVRARRPKFERGLPLLPSLLTVGNLFLGFLSIAEALRGHFGNAALLIIVAGLLDALDGLVARLTNTVSPFGSQLDSLADLVSFGTAPAILVYTWALESVPKLGWALAFLFLVCGAVRLARYNIQPSVVDHRWFIGLPIPAAAMTVAALVWSFPEPGAGAWLTTLVAMLVGALAYLMISPFRYRSLKGVELKRRRPHVIVVPMAIALIVFFLDPPRVGLVAALIYAAWSPAMRIWARFSRPGTAKSPAPDAPGDSAAPQGES